MFRVLAVDLGGTKTAVGVMDHGGALLARLAAPTPLDSYDSALALILRLAREALDLAGPVKGLGLALPGIVDRERGLLLRSPSSGWGNAPFGRAVSDALGIPASCDNDVNACALAEARFGVGRNLGSFFWMTVSTGIGGAVCVDGRVLTGVGGMAGEIGHLVVREGGALCGCGNRGCLEAEAAGPAWRRKALALLEAAGSANRSRGYLGGIPEVEINASSVAAGARSGDSLCLEVLEDVGRALARGVAAITNILDPAAIVVGGGVASSLDLFAPIVETEALGLTLRVPGRRVSLVASALGYDAALIGAGALALEYHEKGVHR